MPLTKHILHNYTARTLHNDNLAECSFQDSRDTVTVSSHSACPVGRLGRGDLYSNKVRCLASAGLQVRIPLQPPRRDLGQALHSQLPVALWLRVNFNTVSIL